MNKTLRTGLIVGSILAAGFILTRPVFKALEAAEGLKIGVGTIKLNTTEPINLLNVASFVNSIPLKLNILLKNFTKNVFKVEQFLVEILTEDDRTIATQDSPLAKEIKITADSTTKLPLNITLSTLPAATLLRGKSLKEILNFFQGGQLGTKIRVRGQLRAEGFAIPFDELIEI